MGDSQRQPGGSNAGAGSVAPLPWVLAARDPEDLRARARALRERISAAAPERLAELASSVAEEVEVLPQRAVVLARRGGEALRALDSLERGAEDPGLILGLARPNPRIAFVFSPLRSEYLGMGLDLLDHYAPFAAQMAVCERALAPLAGWSLDDVLRGRGDTPPFGRLDVSQPALFAFSLSLAALWCSFGVHPDAVLGHSVGEIAAAAACGGLSVADAARVAVTWGRSSMRLEGTGAMASLQLPASEVETRLQPWRGRLAISGLNGPSWTAISGETEALDTLLEELAEEGLAGRRMGIEAPGHSAGMAPIHGWFLEELATISPRQGKVPFCSAVTGALENPADLDARYWSRNLSQPVRFEPAVRALHEDGFDLFLEIGPRPILTGAIEEILAAEGDAVAVGSWEQGEASQFPLQLAEAYVAGVEIEWATICREWREQQGPGPAAAPHPSERAQALTLMLAKLPEERHEQLLLGLVCEEVAAALGHAAPAAIDPEAKFKDLGFDSPRAVDLRNRLNSATGLSLSTTLAFDHPTPRAAALRIRRELAGEETPPQPTPRAAAIAPNAAATERALRAIDDLDLASLVERGLGDAGDNSAEAPAGA